MSERDLVELCRVRGWGAFSDAIETEIETFVRAVLREAGHAELVAALQDARPYVRESALLKDDKRAREILKGVDYALRKASAQ